MGNTNELPLNLYKANLELQIRIGKLLQESGKQWIDLAYRLSNDGISESNAEVDELLQAEDWQKLAALPAESFWRQLQQRFGDSQAMAQIAVTAQTGFVRGLQEAVQTWQKETAGVLGSFPTTAPLNAPAWADLFKPWEQFMPAAFTGVGAAPKKTAPKEGK